MQSRHHSVIHVAFRFITRLRICPGLPLVHAIYIPWLHHVSGWAADTTDQLVPQRARINIEEINCLSVNSNESEGEFELAKLDRVRQSLNS